MSDIEHWQFYCHRCEQWCERRGPWCDLYLKEPLTSPCYFQEHPLRWNGILVTETPPGDDHPEASQA